MLGRALGVLLTLRTARRLRRLLTRHRRTAGRQQRLWTIGPSRRRGTNGRGRHRVGLGPFRPEIVGPLPGTVPPRRRPGGLRRTSRRDLLRRTSRHGLLRRTGGHGLLRWTGGHGLLRRTDRRVFLTPLRCQIVGPLRGDLIRRWSNGALGAAGNGAPRGSAGGIGMLGRHDVVLTSLRDQVINPVRRVMFRDWPRRLRRMAGRGRTNRPAGGILLRFTRYSFLRLPHDRITGRLHAATILRRPDRRDLGHPPLRRGGANRLKRGSVQRRLRDIIGGTWRGGFLGQGLQQPAPNAGPAGSLRRFPSLGRRLALKRGIALRRPRDVIGGAWRSGVLGHGCRQPAPNAGRGNSRRFSSLGRRPTLKRGIALRRLRDVILGP